MCEVDTICFVLSLCSMFIKLPDILFKNHYKYFVLRKKPFFIIICIDDKLWIYLNIFKVKPSLIFTISSVHYKRVKIDSYIILKVVIHLIRGFDQSRRPDLNISWWIRCLYKLFKTQFSLSNQHPVKTIHSTSNLPHDTYNPCFLAQLQK